MPDGEPTLRIMGRPKSAAPRSCVIFSRLTQEEYEGVTSLLSHPKASVSELVRELVSEAVLARLRQGHRSR